MAKLSLNSTGLQAPKAEMCNIDESCKVLFFKISAQVYFKVLRYVSLPPLPLH